MTFAAGPFCLLTIAGQAFERMGDDASAQECAERTLSEQLKQCGLIEAHTILGRVAKRREERGGAGGDGGDGEGRGLLDIRTRTPGGGTTPAHLVQGSVQGGEENRGENRGGEGDAMPASNTSSSNAVPAKLIPIPVNLVNLNASPTVWVPHFQTAADIALQYSFPYLALLAGRDCGGAAGEAIIVRALGAMEGKTREDFANVLEHAHEVGGPVDRDMLARRARLAEEGKAGGEERTRSGLMKKSWVIARLAEEGKGGKDGVEGKEDTRSPQSGAEERMRSGLMKKLWGIEEDQIELGPMIGEGSFGKVYEGVYAGTHVAVKKMVLQVGLKRKRKEGERKRQRQRNHLCSVLEYGSAAAWCVAVCECSHLYVRIWLHQGL